MRVADPMQRLDANLDSEIEAFSLEVLRIFQERRLVRHTSIDIASLTLQQAYEIQDRCISARVSAGEHVIGWKIGCTSRAIQQQFGLSQPICGRLLEPHIYEDGTKFSVSDFIDCAVEPEMVFHIGTDLSDGMDHAALRESIAAVSAGIELHNYHFWYGQPTSQELIASNGIHAALVVGKGSELPTGTDLEREAVSIFVNDALAASGIGAEIMGGPLNSLRWLVLHLARRGERVRAGQVVIPGSAVKLVNVAAGNIA
ncbi:MAG: 2-keto-4-pentenoate hydratase, partial [Terriglobia bacterium]